MANTISNAFIEQYRDAIYMNSEINGGKFAGKIREEMVTGEAAFFETLDSIVASSAGAQFADSPQSDIAHDRRQVTPVDYEVGTMIDKWDKVKLLASFESGYVKRMVEALNRKKDQEVIKAALGDAKTGKTGSTTTNFDYTNQVVPVTEGASSGNAGLNVAKLRAAKAKFWSNGVNVEDPDMKLYIVCSGKQIAELLEDSEVTSSDYNTVKALVNGDVNSFMGFEFIRSELTPFMQTVTGDVELDWATSGSEAPKDTAGLDVRGCFAYAKNAVLLGKNPDIETRIAERADKRFNWYAYCRGAFGGTRMEEVGVVLIPCDQSPS